MFDLGWLEFAIIGLIMILVLGPKELPHAMRSIARFMRKARRLASEFQGHMDDLVREADLDDVKQSINSIKNKDVSALINEAVDPAGEIKKELDGTMADAKREMNAIKSTAGVSPAASVALPTTIETDDKPAGEAEKTGDATAKATPESQPAAQDVPSAAANSAASKV
ncbi:MAG: Sec-independent protein translocase protein TatB [Rhodospirillaceae bacterium]|jgi:sec-independent protein translocase protein TatB|nr:Sec-independent protein translocase protein TatB [Rhodospirillaceae bacterium]